MILREDLQLIADLVEPGSKVLDVGCSHGELLEYLIEKKNIDGRGIDLSQANVSDCVKKGLSVIQGNADTDLKFYPDSCFDYIISSHMLQATLYPKQVLQEMIRISKQTIVSIPNFGYWYNRLYLTVRGRMPVSKSLSYEWYETPNIHFCTVRDFKILCADLGYKIKQQVFLGSGAAIYPNLFSLNAIFLLVKK